MIFNGRLGSIQLRKLFSIIAYAICPVAALWPSATKLAERKGQGRPFAPKALAMAGTFCFYAWLILCCADYAQVSTSPTEMVSENASAGTCVLRQLAGSFIFAS